MSRRGPGAYRRTLHEGERPENRENTNWGHSDRKDPGTIARRIPDIVLLTSTATLAEAHFGRASLAAY
jgi:hypothetical protein